MTITPADLWCIQCGAASEVAISVERNGVIGHYGACAKHIEQVAARVRRDSVTAGVALATPAVTAGGATAPPATPAAPVGQIADAFGVPIGMVSNIVETTATEDDDEDDWVNPVTGHGGDCGCISCHMSQTQ